MITDETFELVELTPWAPPVAPPTALREVPFHARAWLPEDDDALRAHFACDTALSVIAWMVDRSETAVRDRLRQLGLRRLSHLPWSDLEDEELARRYGGEAAAAIAIDFGRAVGSIYARAQLLGLSESNPPLWTEWEDAQLREGYRQGLPKRRIADLIGRPLPGTSSRAWKLGLRHPRDSADWTEAEETRALALAEEGHLYLAIIETLAAEGFPRRTKNGFGQRIRILGYGRGWGRAWTPEEDALLRQTYADGTSRSPLRTRLGRTACSINWRVQYLGLRGTHQNRNGFRQGPDWTQAEEAILRAEYGRTPTVEIAKRLGRGKGGVLQRANVLGLVHGMHKPWTDQDAQVIAIGWRTGIGLPDLAILLDRDMAVVGKYATRLGLSLRSPDRPVKPPRTPRATRAPLTRDDVLARATDADRAWRAIPLKPRGASAPSYPKASRHV